jgi:hypothetical protein
MTSQLDMFSTELSAEPNTNSNLVGLAVRLQFRARHKTQSKPTACRHDPNVVRRAGEIAMTEFAIVVTELSGNKTELCRVGSNPEAVAEGARRKTIPLGRSRRIPRYREVEVVELKP